MILIGDVAEGKISKAIVSHSRIALGKEFHLDWRPIDLTDKTEIEEANLISSNRVKRGAFLAPEGEEGTAIDLSSSHESYHGCGSTKGCFGAKFPDDPNDNCINTGDCLVLVTYQAKAEGLEVLLHGTVENGEYIAMGFSYDDMMGEDLVFSCNAETSPVVESSWNSPYKGNSDLDLGLTISSLGTSYQDSVSIKSCYSLDWLYELKALVR